MLPLVECKDTYFSSGEKHIIRHISLSVFPGDFIMVLGGNGSGKSSLLKLMNRTYPATSGDIYFHQESLAHYDTKTLRQKMVTITQLIGDSLFLELTVAENAAIINAQKISSAELSQYLSQFNPTLSKALNTRVKNLSGGEQQILAFALYLRHQPDLLLLDEHTSALDPKKSDAVMEFTHQFILQKHMTCLMATHELDYALKYGNRLIALRDGAIVFEADAKEKAQLTLIDLLRHCY